MRVPMKAAIAAAGAVAALGLAAPAASATVSPSASGSHYTHRVHWYWVGHNGSLVNVSDNNVGPFQVCHNNVPVNVVGGQVPVSDVVGLLGIGSNGNTATLIDTCDQQSVQNNHGRSGYGHMQWYRYEHGSLVNVSDNNVGPVQACHNNVPVNVVGGQVPIDSISGLLGIGSNGNGSLLVRTCQQSNQQNN